MDKPIENPAEIIGRLKDMFRDHIEEVKKATDIPDLVSQTAQQKKELDKLAEFCSNNRVSDTIIRDVKQLIPLIEELKLTTMNRRKRIGDSLKHMQKGKKVISAYGAVGYTQSRPRVMAFKG